MYRQMQQPDFAFTVAGKAEPAGSKNAFISRSTQKLVVVDDNPKSKKWKRFVKESVQAAHTGEMLEGPLRVEFTVYLARPKYHYGTGRNAGTLKSSAPMFPTVRPDVLKLARGLEDALTGVLWKDDAQIVDEPLHKRYGEPRVEIAVWRLDVAQDELAA